MFYKKPGIIHDDILTAIKDTLRGAVEGETVVLVTPYIKFDPKIRLAITEAIRARVKVQLLIRKDAERVREDSEFLANNHIEVREIEYLHAKVYWSPRLAVVASMNLHSFSERNSYEIGVVFEDKSDITMLRQYIDLWLEHSVLVEPTRLLQHSQTAPSRQTSTKPADRIPATSPASVSVADSEQGHCIRCNKKIKLNPAVPFCLDCYRAWKSAGVKDTVEKHCHACGGDNRSSLARPMDVKCFTKHKDLFPSTSAAK